MSNAVQLSFGFDLAPCGPAADASRERDVLAGIRDKVDSEDMADAFDLYTPDFPEDA